MSKFWKLLEQSTITTGILAVTVVLTACYLAATGTPVPDWFSFALATIIGFFFGGKTQRASIDNLVRQQVQEQLKNDCGGN